MALNFPFDVAEIGMNDEDLPAWHEFFDNRIEGLAVFAAGMINDEERALGDHCSDFGWKDDGHAADR